MPQEKGEISCVLGDNHNHRQCGGVTGLAKLSAQQNLPAAGTLLAALAALPRLGPAGGEKLALCCGDWSSDAAAVVLPATTGETSRLDCCCCCCCPNTCNSVWVNAAC